MPIQLAETHVLHLCSSFSVFILFYLFRNHIHIQILHWNRFKTKTRPTSYFILDMLIIEIISFRFILFSFIYLFRRFLLFFVVEKIILLTIALIYLYYVINIKIDYRRLCFAYWIPTQIFIKQSKLRNGCIWTIFMGTIHRCDCIHHTPYAQYSGNRNFMGWTHATEFELLNSETWSCWFFFRNMCERFFSRFSFLLFIEMDKRNDF